MSQHMRSRTFLLCFAACCDTSADTDLRCMCRAHLPRWMRPSLKGLPMTNTCTHPTLTPPALLGLFAISDFLVRPQLLTRLSALPSREGVSPSVLTSRNGMRLSDGRPDPS